MFSGHEVVTYSQPPSYPDLLSFVEESDQLQAPGDEDIYGSSDDISDLLAQTET